MNGSERIARTAVLICLAALSVRVTEAESKLYFPRILTSGVNGLAIFNPGTSVSSATAAEDQVLLTLYGSNGEPVVGPGVTNPAVLEVPPGQNTAVTVVEVFGAVPPGTVGWVEATSNASDLTGFFLFLSSDQTRLDGADQPRISRKVAFNDVRTSQEFSTEVNIFNTADRTTQIDLYLVGPDGVEERTVGAPPAEGFLPTFPARGLLHIEDLADFFAVASIDDGSYLEVLSDTPIGGFQFLRTSDGDLLGLNAIRRLELLKVLYFPQLAVRGPWKMEVNVVNHSLDPVALVFRATRPDGRPYAAPDVEQNPVVRNLEPFTALVEDVAELFDFSAAGPFEGSLKVAAYPPSEAPLGGGSLAADPVPALSGSVRYGVVATGSEAAVAALPAAQSRAIFSHLATVQGFFTGVAAYNSSSAASNLRIMAFTEGGGELGLFDTILGPGQRIAELITNIIPAAAGQNGGFVWAESSQPLHFSSLFGSSNATLLANVPPQPVPEAFLPDAGKPDFGVDPAAALVRLGGESAFQTLGGSGGGTEWAIGGEVGGNEALGEIDESGAYLAPDVFPQPAGPRPLAAREDELIAAATIDLVETGTFSLEPIQGTLRALAYLPARDSLFGILQAEAVPAGGVMHHSLLEIGADLQTALVDFGEEEMVDVLPFKASTGDDFLLVLSRSDGRLLRVDAETGEIQERAGGLENPAAMIWNPLTDNLLVGDENRVYSVSRVQVESDLVSGIAHNGRLPVALLDVSDVSSDYTLAVDACTGRLLLTDLDSGEIRSLDLVSGSVATVFAGLAAPGSTVAVYRKDAGCSSALRLLVTETGPAQRVMLVDPVAGQALLLDEVSSPNDILFVSEGLDMEDTVLVAGLSSDSENETNSEVFTARVPDQHQSQATNAIGLGRPGSLADPLGDTYGVGFEHDILDLSAYADATDLHVSVAFAATISPCDGQCLSGAPVNALKGFLDLDLDRNGETGALAFSDLNSSADSGLGVEACAAFEFYDEAQGGLPILVLVGEEFEDVGRVPVTFESHSLSFSIPLSLLGQVGPTINLAGVFGTVDGATDVVPNTGFVTTVAVPDSVAAATARRLDGTRDGRRIYRRSRVEGWVGLRAGEPDRK